MRYIIFIGSLFLLACHHPNCQRPNALRCSNNEVQVCGADNEWHLAVDCSRVEPGEWHCEPNQSTCVVSSVIIVR